MSVLQVRRACECNVRVANQTRHKEEKAEIRESIATEFAPYHGRQNAVPFAGW